MTTTERAKRWHAIVLLAVVASACGAKEAVQSTGGTSDQVTVVGGTSPSGSDAGSGGTEEGVGQTSSSVGGTPVGSGGSGATGSPTGSPTSGSSARGGSGGSGAGRTGSGGSGTGGGGNGTGAGGGGSPPTGSVGTPAPSKQTISFPPIAGGWVFGETRTVIATASSGLAVTFSASGACQTVNSALGVVKASDVGECRVTAQQPGGPGVQAAAPVSQSAQIGKATPAIQFADQRFEFDRSGAPVPLSATVSSGAPAQFRLVSDDPNGPLCTVDGNQLLLDVPNTRPARCTIEAFVDASGPFEGASASATFTVDPTFVTFTSYSDASVSVDAVAGTATATVTVELNREWGIDSYSDCDGSTDSQSGSASYTVTVSFSVGSAPCSIDVSTSQPDGAVTPNNISVPVSLP
jgi:hypothetical protein